MELLAKLFDVRRSALHKLVVHLVPHRHKVNREIVRHVRSLDPVHHVPGRAVVAQAVCADECVCDCEHEAAGTMKCTSGCGFNVKLCKCARAAVLSSWRAVLLDVSMQQYPADRLPAGTHSRVCVCHRMAADACAIGLAHAAVQQCPAIATSIGTHVRCRGHRVAEQWIEAVVRAPVAKPPRPRPRERVEFDVGVPSFRFFHHKPLVASLVVGHLCLGVTV